MAIRQKVTRNVSLHIEPAEKRLVIQRVNEAAYYLYDHYRTAFFADASDIKDENVAEAIGWTVRKVLRYRQELQKANLLKISRIGSGEDAITKMIVGADRVALVDAGLPTQIMDQAAFTKLKYKFNIETPEQLVEKAQAIQEYYELNKSEFS